MYVVLCRNYSLSYLLRNVSVLKLLVQKNQIKKQFPVLKTKRLTLREFNQGDLSSLIKYYSDESSMEHYDIDPVTTEEYGLYMLNMFIDRFRNNTGIRWAIELNETKEVIGDIGFNEYDGWNQKSDIGYFIRKDYWRKGLISEAVSPVIEWAFKKLDILELNRIEAETTLTNTPSINLLKKFNFKEEGILRKSRNFRNKIIDIRMFSLLKEDYFQNNQLC